MNDKIEFIKFSISPKVINNKYFFIETDKDLYNIDKINSFKSILKKNPHVYELLIDILSPVYTFNHKKEIKKFIINAIEKKNAVVLNLGSGNSHLHKEIYNIDIFPYDNVNIICDIEKLPLQSNSVDAIINLAVLEHVKNPNDIINEIFRVLKPGGMIFSSIPFIQAYHASPNDFQRYTYNGIIELHRNFETIKIISGGPTSGFLWVFQDWLAILFSFGSSTLYRILLIFFMVLTFPIKFIDILLQHYPNSKSSSSYFSFIGRKPIQN